jgi:hypothetical protein
MALPGLVAAKNLADVADRERAWDNLGLNITRQASEELSNLAIGQSFGGGFFAGYISHTQNGNPTHALIVAPRATGATGTGYDAPNTTTLQLKTTQTATDGTTSTFDGAANTIAMTSTTELKNAHPAAKFCDDLTIGGFTDWYLPSRYELDIAYFNLKPSTALNDTTFGVNPFAVPRRDSNWTAVHPARTSVVAFTTSTEAFSTSVVFHWTSTQTAASASWAGVFINGGQGPSFKTNALLVRAFRRIAL